MMDTNRFQLDFKHLLTSGWFNLSILLIILLTQALEPISGDFLGFRREEISNGEFWRLFTGQLVHTNLNHALLNGSGLLLIMLSFQYEQNYKFDIPCFLLCALFVGLGIYFFVPTIGWYKGLSGILHGYFIYYLFASIRSTPKMAIAALIVITGKVVWEQTPFADLSSTEDLIESRIAIESHLSGAIAGYIFGIIYFFQLQKKEVNQD